MKNEMTLRPASALAMDDRTFWTASRDFWLQAAQVWEQAGDMFQAGLDIGRAERAAEQLRKLAR